MIKKREYGRVKDEKDERLEGGEVTVRTRVDYQNPRSQNERVFFTQGSEE